MKAKIFVILSIVSLSFSFKCGHDKYKKIPKIEHTSSEIQNDKTRRLDSAHSMSFFVDYTQLDRDNVSNSYKKFLKETIEDTLKLFSELLKVRRTSKISIKNPLDCYNEIKYYDKSIQNGVDKDLILIPIITKLDAGVLASGGSCYLDGIDNRPIMGVVLLNKNYSYKAKNSKEFLTMLLFHEITHVLVFSDVLFDYFNYSGVKTKKKTINGVTRTLLTTKKVKYVASQHFGCSSLTGVELENQGKENNVGSHWEARVMLGDYMISTDYLENVISDISLALFEDSGWYEVNYYTGGLFRFGKGQGCDFLNSKCISNDKSNFEWDFCDSPDIETCTSNNLNRARCYLVRIASNIDNAYKYFTDPREVGWEDADYCPVPMGGDGYFYENCIYGVADKKYPESLGFSISNSSICIQSSLFKSNDTKLKYYNYTRAMCHKITCNYNNKTIKVDIGDSYIECPKGGGEMTVNGYDGTIICPLYDRVCNGEVYEANPIQAVLKHIKNADISTDKNFDTKLLSSSFNSLNKFIFLFILILL